MYLGKRGDEILAPEVIFIVLNLIIIGAVSVFVWSSSSGVQVFEESYVENIAMVLNGAEPGSTILINLEEPLDVFANKVFDEKKFSDVFDKPEVGKIVSIDNKKKMVTLMLSGTGGHKTSYFSDYFFESRILSGGVLSIKVMEDENE